MENGTNITAIDSRPSECVDIDGAVDVTAEFGGQVGEVTLAPSAYDGTLRPYGDCPDHWISGALLRTLMALPDADFATACQQLASVARDFAEENGND